jgi:hypothetical protein
MFNLRFRIGFYWRLFTNPKKLWALPDVIQQFIFQEWHERDLDTDALQPKDEKGRCLKHGVNHAFVADDFKDMLGPFWEAPGEQMDPEEIRAINALFKGVMRE